MESQVDLWADKYTFFWYNAPEIFHWTEKDFDAHAKTLHESGITRVMTFSVTHFRLCYYHFWDQILDTIEKIIKSCHKYGIKVVEHHSSCLVYYPDTPKSKADVEGYMKLHSSSPEDFKGFWDYIVNDPELEPGVRLSDLFQISGRTGKAGETPYRGRAACFNNPHYRRIYTKHLHEIVKRGIDAILADDVQLFGTGQSCTCKYCRALFKERTGHDLPSPDEWEKFYFDFNNPLYREFLEFQQWTTQNFQHYLTEKYKEWGINVLRPNYRARLLARDYFATTFSSCWEYWEHVFQENCFSDVIKLSWPVFYTESIVQYAYGRRKNVPSMSLFYPERYDQYYFAWALSESWGQLPFLCPEGFNMKEEDQIFNTFEKKYADMFRDQQKSADCAFLISRNSLDHAPDAIENTYYPLNSLIQAAYFNGLISDSVSEDETQEAFNNQKCIISIGTALVTEELAEKLFAYLEQGGTLLIYGVFGTFMPPKALRKILDHKNTKQFPWTFGQETYQSQLSCMRMYGNVAVRPAPPYAADFLRHGPGQQLRSNLPSPAAVEKITIGYNAMIYTQKKSSKHLTLHVLDVRDLLVVEGTECSHDDLLVNYCKDAPLNQQEIEIVLNRNDIHNGRLVSPSVDKEQQIIIEQVGQQTVIRIPAGSFSGYAALDLTV